MNRRKVLQIGNSPGLTIPFEVISILNLKKGDTVEFRIMRSGAVRLYKCVITARYNKKTKRLRRNR